MSSWWRSAARHKAARVTVGSADNRRGWPGGRVRSAIELAEFGQLRKDKRRLKQEKRNPGARDGVLRASRGPKLMYPLVQELAADRVPVTVACGVLGLCRQTYYRWLASPVCERDWNDAHTINRMRAIHDEDPDFGYRFIADELELAGHRTGEDRVQRLRARAHLLGDHRQGPQARPPRPASPRRPGVKCDLDVEELDRVWLTDISEHPTAEGKLYICAIKRQPQHDCHPNLSRDLGADTLQPLGDSARDPLELVSAANYGPRGAGSAPASAR